MITAKLNQTFDGEFRDDKSKSTSLIDTFLSEVRTSGVARTNLFEVRINPPIPTSRTIRMSRSLTLRAESAVMPGINLATAQDVNIYGPVRDVVEGVNYADEIAITFLETRDHEIRKYFTELMEFAYDPHTWNLKYYNDYATGDVQIFQLNNQQEVTYGVKLWEAYPKNFGPIQYSSASTNEVVKLTVNFNFRYWTDITKYGTRAPMTPSERAASRPPVQPESQAPIVELDHNNKPITITSIGANGSPSNVVP